MPLITGRGAGAEVTSFSAKERAWGAGAAPGLRAPSSSWAQCWEVCFEPFTSPLCFDAPQSVLDLFEKPANIPGNPELPNKCFLVLMKSAPFLKVSVLDEMRHEADIPHTTFLSAVHNVHFFNTKLSPCPSPGCACSGALCDPCHQHPALCSPWPALSPAPGHVPHAASHLDFSAPSVLFFCTPCFLLSSGSPSPKGFSARVGNQLFLVYAASVSQTLTGTVTRLNVMKV